MAGLLVGAVFWFLLRFGRRVVGIQSQISLLPAVEPPGSSGIGISSSFRGEGSAQSHWALLVAGSNGWSNYRHQADVAHAHKVLLSGGYQADRVVTMMFDDIAYSPENPYPGQIFNKPDGPDVYQGLKVDYSGADVTAETFLAVLAGDRVAVIGKGSGKVIASGPSDRIFVYYTDHGAPGVLGMPSGGFLYADEMMEVVQKKTRSGGFREMVVFIEACYSGSLFEGMLGSSLGVYAITAANSREKSWGTYCPAPRSTAGSLGTCLGDLFSVAWMENAEENDLTIETLQEQFLEVKRRTSNNYTYNTGSHVVQFGQLAIQEEAAAEFEGDNNRGMGSQSVSVEPQPDLAQEEADLEHLRHLHSYATDTAERDAAKSALCREEQRRLAVDAAVDSAATHLLMQPKTSGILAAYLRVPAAPQQPPLRGSSPRGGLAPLAMPPPESVSLLVNDPLPGRPVGSPVVDSWDCLRSMVQQWEASCGSPMDQYSMKHTRFLANLCNAGLGKADLQEALQQSGCRSIARESSGMTKQTKG